ncbi:hypothetical protein SAMN05443247_08152 [Bradyrhizobium erythrophlei]|nr:hypothetical protein SAMN05443247_08152 [Bradyrhizobium erythrophlei]
MFSDRHSELLFLLFGLPFGDALYHGKITALHWVYLAIAVTCAIGGPMWPAMRNRWASPRVATSVANAARDARVWVALLLAFFLYGVSPDIYRRATAPSVLPPPATPIEIPNPTPLPTAVPTGMQYRNEMSLKAALATSAKLAMLFSAIPGMTFVITAPPENELFKNDFYALIVATCQREPSAKCIIEPAPDPKVDIDAGIPDPQYPGIVIHHAPATPYSDSMVDSFMYALGCFHLKKSSRVPESIARLNIGKTPNFYWFELGNGSPWNANGACG